MRIENFFLLDRVAIDRINECRERNAPIHGLIIWVGFKQDYIEYDRKSRRLGKSKWSFLSLTNLGKNWIIAFSDLPLVSISVLGAGIVFVGILYALYLFIAFISGSGLPGWAAVTAAIMILGGLQIAAIGIIGEYIWRALDESRRRPLYFVEKRT